MTHIEQDPDSTLTGFRSPEVWIQALQNTFPPLASPVPTTAISFQYEVAPDTTYTGMMEAMIRAKEGYQDEPLDLEDRCEAAGDGFSGKAKEVLLRWNVGGIPENSSIEAAEITLNIINETTEAGYHLYQVKQPWLQSEATWLHFNKGAALVWEVPGALGALDRGVVPFGRLAPPITGVYTFSVNPAVVQSWFDAPDDNHGLLIANPSNDNRVIFSCGDSAIAAHRPKLTVYYSQNSGGSDTPNPTPAPTETPTVSGEIIYLSGSTSPVIGEKEYDDEDILAYDTTTGNWSRYFDGSDVGLNGSDANDLDAFHIMPDGSILLSVNGKTTLPDVGEVEAADIIRFTPTSLGDITAGTFSWYLDGSDVQLGADQDIAAIGMIPEGDLLISTNDSGNVGFNFDDDDLLQFNAASLGEDTAGSWSRYFEGSDVGLGGEDIRGIWVDSTTGDIYFTLLDEYAAVGDRYDIFVCRPQSLGDNTSCLAAPTLYWDGSAHSIGDWRPDGLHIQR